MSKSLASTLKPDQIYYLDTNLGTIAYKSCDFFYFENGLFGFEECKNYIISHLPFDGMPDCYRLLQSIDNPEISMIILNIEFDKKNIKKNVIDLEHLKVHLESRKAKVENCLFFLIVAIHKTPDNGQRLSINTKAPVVMSVKDKKAWQIILEEPMYEVCKFIS